MSWTQSDLDKIKQKGFTTTEYKSGAEEQTPAPKKKIEKVSVEKNTIGFILIELKQKEIIKSFDTEFIFDKTRRFRFDWIIPEHKIAIEYEGIFSTKSRHTTINGFTEDCTKYNLAIQNGWRVLRYTAKNYQNLQQDLLLLLGKNL